MISTTGDHLQGPGAAPMDTNVTCEELSHIDHVLCPCTKLVRNCWTCREDAINSHLFLTTLEA
eukprot:2021286-Pyramimonas_sp.AAC.1